MGNYVVVCSKIMLLSLCHVISTSTGQWISLPMLCDVTFYADVARQCSLQSYLQFAEVCTGVESNSCFALPCCYLMDKFLMPEAITGSHVCEEPGPLCFIFPSSPDFGHMPDS